MKSHITTCDHCGTALDTMIDFDDVTIEMAHKWVTADLCEQCLEELYSIVNDFVKKRSK